jgi:hypothetical protein
VPEPTSGRKSTAQLIVLPALITLAITILRVVGELQHWPKLFFNPGAGGGGAIIGISWLPIIFGPYFALKLAGAGEGPCGVGKAIGFAVLGLVLLIGGGTIGFSPQIAFPEKIIVGLLLMIAGAALQFGSWPALTKVLLAYGYAARIPVAIIMYFAIQGNWGTHYDALPPEYKGPMDFWGKYLAIGLVPQLIFWVAFTILVGALIGSIVVATRGRGKAAATAAP